jgi:drug/metabolite transporter (DMT)-like permease
VSFPTELPSLISQTPRYGALIPPAHAQTGHLTQNTKAEDGCRRRRHCFVPLVIVFALHASVNNAYGNFGSLAGYGAGAMYIGAGLFVAISVIQKFGLKRLDLTVAGFVGAAALGYGIYVSFNPLVPFPGDIWLFIFCGILALACASYIWLKLAHRGVLQRIGSSATAPEVMTGHAAEPLIGRSASCEH